MGLDKKMKMYSSSASIEAIAPDDIKGAAEGVYFFENFPRQLRAKDDSFHKEFNRLVGIDDVDAREVGGQRVMDKSHGWQAWEDIFCTEAGDRSFRLQNTQGRRRRDPRHWKGCKCRRFASALPQGDKIIRKDDHASALIDCYISRVENGKLEVKKRIPKEELAKNMPLRHNLSEMPV